MPCSIATGVAADSMSDAHGNRARSVTHAHNSMNQAVGREDRCQLRLHRRLWEHTLCDHCNPSRHVTPARARPNERAPRVCWARAGQTLQIQFFEKMTSTPADRLDLASELQANEPVVDSATPSDRASLWRHPLGQGGAAAGSPSSGGAAAAAPPLAPPNHARPSNSGSSEPHGGQVRRRDEEDTSHVTDAVPVTPDAIYADFTGAGTGSSVLGRAPAPGGICNA